MEPALVRAERPRDRERKRVAKAETEAEASVSLAMAYTGARVPGGSFTSPTGVEQSFVNRLDLRECDFSGRAGRQIFSRAYEHFCGSNQQITPWNHNDAPPEESGEAFWNQKSCRP